MIIQQNVLGGIMRALHFVLVSLAFMLNTMVLATGISLIHVDNPEISNRCRYIRDPYACNETRGCHWDHYNRYCQSYYDDDDGYRSCYNINDPLTCSNRSDCYWSRSQNRCVSSDGGGGGGGGVSPRRCYYIRSYNECENTYPCHWSRSFDRCVGPDDN